MHEKEFWRRLANRVNAEIADLDSDTLRQWRCDSFIPQRFGLVGDRPAIIGRVDMASNHDQQSWHFALLLRDPARNFDDLDWAILLPPDDVTGWLALHPLKKEMKINPWAAYSDSQMD